MRIQHATGKFAQKSDEPRQVRSLRLTDSTWAQMGQAAETRSMTRADLLEAMTWDVYLIREEVEEAPITVEEAPIREQLAHLLQEIGDRLLDDLTLTRQGKDRGVVKRTIAALTSALQEEKDWNP